jgi:hypothetical protein
MKFLTVFVPVKEEYMLCISAKYTKLFFDKVFIVLQEILEK